MDEIIRAIKERLANMTPEDIERRERMVAAYCARCVCEQQPDGTWVARKGGHIGIGPTRWDAITNVNDKIDLQFGGMFGMKGLRRSDHESTE